MNEISLGIIEADSPKDNEYPRYSDKGFILVEIVMVCKPEDKPLYRFEIGESVFDSSNAPFWIKEGMGVDYWLDCYAPDDLKEGWWVFEGVHAYYHKGDGWTTDDDEDWYFDSVRPATDQEIKDLDVTAESAHE